MGSSQVGYPMRGDRTTTRCLCSPQITPTSLQSLRGLAEPNLLGSLLRGERKGDAQRASRRRLLDARGRLLDDGKVRVLGQVHLALHEAELGGHVEVPLQRLKVGQHIGVAVVVPLRE